MQDFDSKLKIFLNNKLLPQNGCPPLLKESIEYSVLLPGKRIRPQLIYASAECFQISKNIADSLALSIELIHCFSLVHDDLPCMDNDDFRRGFPSNHKVYGDATALLAGDAMIALAFESLFEIENKFASAILKCATFFSHSMGANGMIGGQAHEISILQKQSNFNELKEIQRKKTGALFQFSFLAPLFFCTPHEEQFHLFSKCGLLFGQCFQAIDDCEDQTQDSSFLGKNQLTQKEYTENLKTIYQEFETCILELKKINLPSSHNLISLNEKLLQQFGKCIHDLKN